MTDVINEFLTEKCRFEPGQKTLFSDLYEHFYQYMPLTERNQWSKTRFSKAIRNAGHTLLNRTANILWVENLVPA